MIPSYIGSYACSKLIQYKGFIKHIHIDLTYINKVKITDSTTKAILFNSDVVLKSKIDWAYNSHNNSDYRFLFESTKDAHKNSRLFFVSDKQTNKLKYMSLDYTYLRPKTIGCLDIQYKATEKMVCDEFLYELDFEISTDPIFISEELEELPKIEARYECVFN
jgi:hypothetical protein